MNIRWQLLLAAIGFALVYAILSFQEQTFGVCFETVPASGGTFREGLVGAPRALNPLLADGFPVDEALNSLIFDGLTRFDENGRLVGALAERWQVSEDQRTITFTLATGRTWHDGQPVTANDVAFSYGLLQDEALPIPAAVRQLWQAVTITVVDPQTITFQLAEPYSPFLEATTRGILPAHLLAGETAVSLPNSPFNQTPVGTGPFMVPSGQDWRQTQQLRLLPSPNAFPQGVRIDDVALRFFPDSSSLVAAFAAEEIEAMNRITPGALPAVAQLDDARLFTAVSDRTTTLIFNQSETGSTLTQAADGRKGLAYALDRAALIDETLNGQAVPLEGPYLPTSWGYQPELLTSYSYQPVTATALLDAAGWTLPEGAALRQQEGASLTLRLLTLDRPTQQRVAQAVAAQWAAVGVGSEIVAVPDLLALREQLAARTFDVALVEITPPHDPDLYDFWSQEAIIRGQNYGGWNNRRASEALEQGRQLFSQAERRPFYDSFLRFYDSDLPALTLYQHVTTYAISERVNEAEIGRIDHPRERFGNLSSWFLLYEDVVVGCPSS